MLSSDAGTVGLFLSITLTGYSLFKDNRICLKELRQENKELFEELGKKYDQRFENLENFLSVMTNDLKNLSSSLNSRAFLKTAVLYQLTNQTETVLVPLVVGMQHHVAFRLILGCAPKAIDKTKTLIIRSHTKNIIKQEGKDLLTLSDIESTFHVEIEE